MVEYKDQEMVVKLQGKQEFLQLFEKGENKNVCKHYGKSGLKKTSRKSTHSVKTIVSSYLSVRQKENSQKTAECYVKSMVLRTLLKWKLYRQGIKCIPSTATRTFACLL